MRITSRFLLAIINSYQSEWSKGHPQLSPNSEQKDESDYGRLQLRNKTISGIGFDLYKKKVLEIGCGHGGICIYASMVGAKEVVGIDLSDEALSSAEDLKSKIEKETNYLLPIQFKKMEAESLKFDEDELDVIIADNVFEHVDNILSVLKECGRVLKSGGRIIVPNFPSYRSKFGPHVKYGVKIPWVHIFFTEKTIVEVMHTLAKSDPEMYEFYPGLRNNAKNFREIRAYNDLNYISNKEFINYATESGFRIESMFVTRPRWAWLLMKLVPVLRRTALEDILSIGTSAILVKK
jgi:ubiquinone/menaquinone biosynthesis C-methylase UbiE